MNEKINLKFHFDPNEDINLLRKRFMCEIVFPFNEGFKWFNNEKLNCSGCNLFEANNTHNPELIAFGMLLTTNQSLEETVTFNIKFFRNGYGQIKSGDLLITDHWREIMIKIAKLINDELLWRLKFYNKHIKEVEKLFEENI